jgi:hypothetical protein
MRKCPKSLMKVRASMKKRKKDLRGVEDPQMLKNLKNLC